MKKNILALSLFILGWTAPLSAEVMTYQGRLKESNVPVNANRAFLFELCATETPTGCVASPDGAKSFTVQNGLFKSTFTLPAVDLSAGPWYLRVQVEGSYLSPVERLTFVPYSVFASSSAYAGSASALAAISGLGVISSTHVIVMGGLNASDSGVQFSTVAVIEGYALLKNINTGIEDVRVGVSGRVNSDSIDAVDILAGGNFEVEVPINRNGAMIGVRSALRNSGSSALAVGLLVDSLNNSGTIGDTYGVWIATLTQGGQTNKPFALYAEDPNARSYFAGKVGISSSAPAYALSVSSASGDLFWVADDGAHSLKFTGDGSGLTGVTGASGTDSTKLLKAGDTMTGSLLMDAGSTITVTGSDFSVGGATLVVKAGYIGMGTDAPAARLHVVSDNGYVHFASPASGLTINMVPASYTPATFNNNASGPIVFNISNDQKLIMTQQSMVGIGTAVPSYRLHVSTPAGETGVIMAVSTGATNVFSVDGYGVTALKFTGDGSGLTGLTAGAAGTALDLDGGAQGEIPYQTGVSNTAMLAAGTAGQLLQSGGAGAPSWTSAPAIAGTNISVLPPANLSAGSLPGNVIASSIAVGALYEAAFQDPKVNRAGDMMYGSLDVQGAHIKITADTSADQYSFAAGTGTVSSHLYVSTSGNVGLGITNPNARLTLPYNGYIGWDANNDGVNYNGHRIGKSITGAAPLEFRNDTNPGAAGRQFSFFYSGNELFTILNGGDVGIGKTNPAARLDVAGTGSFSGSLSTLSSGTFRASGASQFSVEASSGILVQAGRIQAPAIQLTNGAAANYVLTSDAAGNASWVNPVSGGLGDGWVGNEITDAGDTTLTRSGTGAGVDPYKLALNLSNANTWVAAQTFSGGLTGSLAGAASQNILKAGDTMTGSLTLAGSTLTVAGDAFSVGGSTFVVGAGRVGVGTLNPAATLDLYGKMSASYLEAHNTGNANKLLFRLSQWSEDGLLELLNASETYGVVLNAAPAAPSYIVAGNFGVGTNVPDQKLTVAGNISQTGVLISSGTGRNYFAGDVTAARYQVGGSTVLAILPGISSLGVGLDAGPLNTGDGNLFAGIGAGKSNGSGFSNSFLGTEAGYTNTTGQANSFVGYYAGRANNFGVGNTFVGNQTGLNNDGNSNSFFGANSGVSNSVGNNNVFIGAQSGANANGSNNIVIGYNKDTSQPIANDELNVGGVLYGDLSAKTIGISTRVPQAALDIVSTGTVQTQFAQIWRDSNGNIQSSMSVTGVMMASRFVGDGSGLTGVSGSDATKLPLAGGNMIGQLTNISSVTITGNGGGAYGLEVSSNVSLAGALYSANGNVGIGSAAPGAKLDVYSFNTTSFLEVHNASIGGKRSFRVFQSNNHGLLDVFDTAEAIAIRLNADNTSPSYINAGNVGVGTTLPDQKLTVAGNISQTGVLISSGAGNNYFAGNVGVAAPNPIGVFQVGGGSLTVLAGGNVGIGTIAPQSHLHIDNALNATSAGAANLALLVRHNTITAGGGPGIGFSSDNTPGVGAKIVHIRTGSNSQGDLAFYTKTTNAVPESEKLRIRDNGNVGISTGAPQARLDVLAAGNTIGDYAQIWRDSGGIVKASVTATGVFYGDGSGLTGVLANDSSKLPLTGGTLTGGLTVSGSTLAVRGPGDLMFLNSSNNWGIMYLSEGATQRGQLGYGNGGTVFIPGEIPGAMVLNGNTALQLGANSLMALTISPTGKTGVGFKDPLYALDISTVNPTDQYLLRAGADGILISTGGAITTTGLGHGTVSGNPRGNGAVDLQTIRLAAAQVASGGYSVIGGGQSNTASGMQSTVGGGDGNTASSQYSVVGGGNNNTATLNAAVVAGGSGNDATAVGSSIAGGVNNLVSASWSALGGGAYNVVSGSNSVIGGGGYNTVIATSAVVSGGEGNKASGMFSAVSGGSINIASGLSAGIGGGKGNSASGSEATVSGGGYNTASGIDSTIGGGIMNQATNTNTTVGGGLSNKATIYAATVGGGSNNTAAANYAVIPGGLQNTVDGANSSIAGGAYNIASGSNSAVSGGQYNVASGTSSVTAGGENNKASGLFAAVSGGFHNTASGLSASVAGGKGNTASGDYAAVAGGQDNVANSYAASVAGGWTNTANNNYAAVSGGIGNTASGFAAMVSGGRANTAGGSNSFVGGGGIDGIGTGGSNQAQGSWSAVVGGNTNTASQSGAAVVGGEFNVAKGMNSFIGGGGSNVAGGWGAAAFGANSASMGDYSFAAGLQSTSAVNGTFTWADSSAEGAVNNVVDQVMFKARGGFWVSTGTVYGNPGLFVDAGNRVGIGTSVPGYKLHVKADSGGSIAGFNYSATATDAAVYGWANSGAVAIKGVASSGYAGRFEGNVYIGDATPVGASKLVVEGTTSDNTASALDAMNSAGSSLLFVRNDGNVGIGTLNPASKLTVLDGDITISTTIGSRGIIFQDGSTQFIAAGASQWAASGSDIYNLNAGNVGVGTVSPLVKFHNNGPAILASNVAIDPDTYANSVIAGNITDGGLNMTGIGGKATNAGSTWGIGHNNADLIFAAGDGTNPNTLQTFMQATWKRNLALVPVGGRVGVGLAAATVPDQKLTVIGNISQTGVLISSGAGNNYFEGNVGIGTSNPGAKLHVSGGATIFEGDVAITTNSATGGSHLRSSQISPPGFAASNPGCGTTAPTGNVNGTDMAGTITLNTGTAPGGTCTVTVTFNRWYAIAPKAVLITPMGSNTHTLNASINPVPTISNFVIQANAAVAPTTSYSWSYIVIE